MAQRETKSARLPADPRGDSAALESVRAGLAGRLRLRRSEIAEAIFARFRDIGFDPADGEDAAYVAGARAAITEALDYGLGAIERGEEWFGSIPPAAVAQARRAARNGVTLDKVLLRNNAAHTVLETSSSRRSTSRPRALCCGACSRRWAPCLTTSRL